MKGGRSGVGGEGWGVEVEGGGWGGSPVGEVDQVKQLPELLFLPDL